MFRFLKRFVGGDSRRTARTTLPSFRPALEAYEERVVPSTLNVYSPADNGAVGTLRWAVKQADYDASHGRSDTIQFASSMKGHTINLNSPLQLSGTQKITINATNDNITVSGQRGGFVVQHGANVELDGLTMAHCDTSTSGGALFNNGSLSLVGCAVDFNQAGYYGGAVCNNGNLWISNSSFVGNSAHLSGGAIFNTGTVNDYGGYFVSNSAGHAGGAIYNDTNGLLYVLSNNNTFASNHANGGDGGAIYNGGYATVVNAYFGGNTTAYSGGAVANFGTVNVSSSTFDYNSAKNYGGGFYDAQGGSWSVHGSWLGNSAGKAGKNYYTPTRVG
jgi:predicted outer membrane repeat protein